MGGILAQEESVWRSEDVDCTCGTTAVSAIEPDGNSAQQGDGQPES
jgi:hypothetical protein